MGFKMLLGLNLSLLTGFTLNRAHFLLNGCYQIVLKSIALPLNNSSGDKQIGCSNVDLVIILGLFSGKIIFLGPVEGVSSVLRPHLEEVVDGRALVVQAQPHIVEIIPTRTSKADGVKVLLHHLNISPKEIMVIGTGENDAEMLELASLGVALENGSEKAKAAANVIGATNDDDGLAMAIYQYAF